MIAVNPLLESSFSLTSKVGGASWASKEATSRSAVRRPKDQRRKFNPLKSESYGGSMTCYRLPQKYPNQKYVSMIYIRMNGLIWHPRLVAWASSAVACFCSCRLAWVMAQNEVFHPHSFNESSAGGKKKKKLQHLLSSSVFLSRAFRVS